MFGRIDAIVAQVDTLLRTLFVPENRPNQRTNPGEMHACPPLTPAETRLTAGLMRVNHAGEVCAQALYQGQALTAQLTHVREQMAAAALEEVDHLAWCEQRLQELHSHPSVLNPIWYGLSFLLGASAGLLGDRFSLGFVAETERQVTHHLQQHLSRLPPHDHKTTAILRQMQADEIQHAKTAGDAGAIELPFLIKQGMSTISKAMTWSSYYI